MGTQQQSRRIEARKQIRAALAERRRAQAERETAIAESCSELVALLAERDEAERTAAQVVQALTEQGLTPADISQWCAEAVSAKQIGQLRQAAADRAARPAAPAPAY
jgi:ABC-type xylose transport system substrate-binding protein